jgi:hypothetical protein
MSENGSAAGTFGNLVGAHMPFKVQKLFHLSAIVDHLPPRLRRANDGGKLIGPFFGKTASKTGGY